MDCYPSRDPIDTAVSTIKLFTGDASAWESFRSQWNAVMSLYTAYVNDALNSVGWFNMGSLLNAGRLNSELKLGIESATRRIYYRKSLDSIWER